MDLTLDFDTTRLDLSTLPGSFEETRALRARVASLEAEVAELRKDGALLRRALRTSIELLDAGLLFGWRLGTRNRLAAVYNTFLSE